MMVVLLSNDLIINDDIDDSGGNTKRPFRSLQTISCVQLRFSCWFCFYFCLQVEAKLAVAKQHIEKLQRVATDAETRADAASIQVCEYIQYEISQLLVTQLKYSNLLYI